MENENRIIIPESFLIVVDDVGWWLEGDKRYFVNVPESGLAQAKRPYYFEDYVSLVEMGKALDMRILCGLTIGEWDRDKLLANVPGSNMYGSKWTNSEPLQYIEKFELVRDYINSNSKHVEMALHGLNHMFWDDKTGECIFAEFYKRKNGLNVMHPEEIMRQHLDAWFQIYERNGFTAKVDKFIPCCFYYNYSNGSGELSHILKDYGIKYVSTIFNMMGYDCPEKPRMACIENGILTTDRTADLSDWFEMDAKIPSVLKSSYYGTHWPHFTSPNPEDNMINVRRWIEYFKQYKDKFDVLFARDHEMGAKQIFYRRFTKLKELSENQFALDFSEADAQGASEELVGKSIYLNVKKPYKIQCVDGSAEVEIWNERESFSTYKVTRCGSFANIVLK
jgi:hypothetical protein